MEIKKIILLLFLIPSIVFGQEETVKHPKRVVDNGMLSGGLTFAAGFANSNVQNVYVQGYAEYMFQKNVSIRGDVFVFLHSLGDNAQLDMNHQMLVFAAYHFPVNSAIDPYLGFGPGIAMTRLKSDPYVDPITGSSTGKIAASPFITFNTGLRYYAPKWFHMYLEAGYVLGRHISSSGKFDMSELRVSFGLGFNINVLTYKGKKNKKAKH